MSKIRNILARLDRLLDGISYTQSLFVAFCGVVMIGFMDYVTGYEVSISILYLGPVLIAAWYGRGGAGVAISILVCGIWFTADVMGGRVQAHPVIEAWNVFLRLGELIVFVSVAAALRLNLSNARQLARADALTGLCNRRAFEELLEHDLALARRNHLPLTIVYLDLDNFKILNDTRGHAEGDRALHAIGHVLRERIYRRGDTAARLGGDEFALVLPDTDQHGAKEVVTNLRQYLKTEFELHSWQLGCSVGAVTFLAAPANSKEALAMADALMYEAKRQGKDTVVFKVVEHIQGRIDQN